MATTRQTIPVNFWQPLKKGLTDLSHSLIPRSHQFFTRSHRVQQIPASDEGMANLYENLATIEVQLQYLDEIATLNRENLAENLPMISWADREEKFTDRQEIKLAEFRAQVELTRQQDYLEFLRWSLSQKKVLQLQIKALEAELQGQICQHQRQTALAAIEEQKKLNNSPIWLVASQIIQSHRQQELIPLQIFFSPPTIPGDRTNLDKLDRGMQGFPEMSDYLAESLRSFVKEYAVQGRNIDFMYGAWTSKFFHSEAATQAIFDALHSEPTLILESYVEKDYFNLRLGFWGENWPKYRYQSAISRLSWVEALYDFAKARSQSWHEKEQQWIADGKTVDDFYQVYGSEPVKQYQNNLETLQREIACIAAGEDPKNIERSYLLRENDRDDLRQFIATCHCLVVGLIADEYFLVHVPPSMRLPPLLPELLPKLLANISAVNGSVNGSTNRAVKLADLIPSIVEFYQHLYQFLATEESAWTPELALDLSLSLRSLADQSWLEDRAIYSMQQWLKLHQLSQPEGLEALRAQIQGELTVEDQGYIDKLNQCLTELGVTTGLSIVEAYYQRGLHNYQQKEYQKAVTQFDQVLELKPDSASAYYQRGLACGQLKLHQNALADYSQVIHIQPEHEAAYFARGNEYYQLKYYQKAIADYDAALKIRPGWPEVEKQRAIAQRVIDKIHLQQQATADQTEEFSFEIIQVNPQGDIIHRQQCVGHQTIEQLGNDITLDMVYIPGGEFMMGSPETENGRSPHEESPHFCQVRSFFLGKYPVTQAQWQEIMGNNPSRFQNPNCPVEKVSWDEAVEFCHILSEITGQPYCLPTETQWEYACRAGTTTPFYFGDTITPDLANYDGSWVYGSGYKGINRGKTTPVGSFPPNAFGLYDLHGNVWEWCASSLLHEAKTPGEDTENSQATENQHIRRGGGWYNVPGNCRSAYRDAIEQDYRSGNLGFRVALAISCNL